MKTAKALADVSRLLILNELRGGPLYSEELVCRLDLAPSTVSFHVKKLAEVGLIAVRREQYYTRCELATDALGLTLAELISFEPTPQPALDGRRAEERMRVGKAFFSGGRLVRMPAQRRRRLTVLEHFASLFEPGRDYDEREVDAVIQPVFADYCLVRRLLVDEGHMRRSRGVYRLTGKPAAAIPTEHDAREVETVKGGEERKRLKEEYKGRARTAGVFTITNTVDGRVLLGSCLDAERPLRRIRFELELGSFRNRELQADFSRLGKDAFRFAVVETVDSDAKAPADELERLEKKHLAALDRATAYNRDDRIRFR